MSGDTRSDDSSKTVLIIVGAILGGLLLLGLVCGGITFLAVRGVTNAASGIMATMQQMMTEMQEAETAAANFLNDLAANRPDEAYAAASQGFQKRQTKEEFRAFVEQNPLVKGAAGTPHDPVQQTPGSRITYQYHLNANGPATCTLQVVKEDGQWRVDALTVP